MVVVEGGGAAVVHLRFKIFFLNSPSTINVCQVLSNPPPPEKVDLCEDCCETLTDTILVLLYNLMIRGVFKF